MTFRIAKGVPPYEVHVLDPSGFPSADLTFYANWAPLRHSRRTAVAYVRELVVFMGWAHADPVVVRQGWTLFGDPADARALIEHFLVTQLRYAVSLRPDKHGFDTKRLEPKWGVSRSASQLLAALRSLYEILKDKGRYRHPNPMDGDNAVELLTLERRRAINAFVDANGRTPMHFSSGVDAPTYRLPVASYFRLQREWTPQPLDDPTLRLRVLQAGESWGWNQRESCIANILFDTGCRIHEVCALTIGDWQHSQLGRELSSINKGSRGRRTKTLHLRDSTVKALHEYVEGERYALVDLHLTDLRTLPVDQAFETPLFVTRRGTPMCADYFRSSFWTPALAKGGLQVRPHQVRHWFVTMALLDIEDQPISIEEKEHLRVQLKLLMGWRSDMLPTYDQAIRTLRLPLLAEQIHLAIEMRQVEANRIPARHVSTPNTSSKMQVMLDEILGNC